MKAMIRDKEAIQAISPMDAASYLRAKDWHQIQSGERASLWSTRDGAFEVFLPLDTTAGDYALRMGDLLQTLALAEERSQIQIYRDLLTIGFDAVRIRVDDPEMVDGSLPLEQYTQIAQKTRELILSAACSVIEKRPVWHTRKPAKALEHMRRVRIGQSEQGSYIITILCRVTPHLYVESDVEPEETFERQVTLNLANLLHKLEQASGEAVARQELAAFAPAIKEGVSANLCEAVAGFWGEESNKRQLEFLFSWSPARPVALGVLSKVRFSSDRAPLLRAAGKQMREMSAFSDVELVGPVIKLERAKDAETGKATLFCNFEEKQIRVAVELGGDLYRVATRAHEEGYLVTLRGTLQREGRIFSIKNLYDFVAENS